MAVHRAGASQGGAEETRIFLIGGGYHRPAAVGYTLTVTQLFSSLALHEIGGRGVPKAEEVPSPRLVGWRENLRHENPLNRDLQP